MSAQTPLTVRAAWTCVVLALVAWILTLLMNVGWQSAVRPIDVIRTILVGAGFLIGVIALALKAAK